LVGQPPLTKSIQRLEKLLGAKLLDPSKRGVHPTAIGEQLIRRAGTLALKATAGIVQLQGRTLPPLAEAFMNDVVEAAQSVVAPSPHFLLLCVLGFFAPLRATFFTPAKTEGFNSTRQSVR
jgi:hypothetical protein